MNYADSIVCNVFSMALDWVSKHSISRTSQIIQKVKRMIDFSLNKFFCVSFTILTAFLSFEPFAHCFPVQNWKDDTRWENSTHYTPLKHYYDSVFVPCMLKVKFFHYNLSIDLIAIDWSRVIQSVWTSTDWWRVEWNKWLERILGHLRRFWSHDNTSIQF